MASNLLRTIVAIYVLVIAARASVTNINHLNARDDLSPRDKNPITKISQLYKPEKKVVEWVKKYTVPNTRDANGNSWDRKYLPQPLLDSTQYKKSTTIKPAAWAAAVVTAFSIHEDILHVGDFYRAPKVPKGTSNGLVDNRCDKCFAFPAQYPPKTDFPTEVFSYNFCQGNTGGCDCSSTPPGQLIGPNQTCQKHEKKKFAWQNGIWGMEQTHVASAKDMAARAEKIYTAVKGTKYTYRDVLDNTLTQAGFPKGTQVYDNVMKCVPIVGGKPRAASDLSMTCADLVTMWLTRNHLVGLTVALHDNDKWKFGYRLPTIQTLAVYYNS